MDVYILDSLLRRSEVIDKYISLIWTERFSSYGEFELIVESNRRNRQLLKEETHLSISKSHRVMIIETIEDQEDSEGRYILKVKGPSLEKKLTDRALISKANPTTLHKSIVINDQPSLAAEEIFNMACVVGGGSTLDGNFGIILNSPLDKGELIYGYPAQRFEFAPDYVYTHIKWLAETYGFGFRVVRIDGDPQLYFDVYNGRNRTTEQSYNDVVIFSRELGNLKNTKELRSSSLEKTVAYVYSDDSFIEVVAEGTEANLDGFDRKVVLVKVSPDSSLNPTERHLFFVQKGKEALAGATRFSAFDGEIVKVSQYIYEENYSLGDFVELRSSDDNFTKMRVVEQIFVNDQEGFRSYPTLSFSPVVDHRTWEGWPNTLEWDDLDPSISLFWENADNYNT